MEAIPRQVSDDLRLSQPTVTITHIFCYQGAATAALGEGGSKIRAEY